MNSYFHRIKNFFSIIPFGGRKNFDQQYYTSMISQHSDYNFYLSLYHKASTQDHLRTNVEICLSRSLRFGCTIKEIKGKFREPSNHLKKITPLNAEIYLYKMLIGNHKVKCQLHLFDGKLFMYKYIFPYLENDRMNEIINVIQEKYLPEVTNYSRQNIIDPNNNCLHIDDSTDLTISYLSLDSEFFKKIINISLNKEQRIKKTASALYNDIFNRI
jgi:hypothetical protein